MPLISGINDSYIMQPVVQIKQNLSIWTLGHWEHYQVEFIEGLPPGPASIQDMLAIAVPAATTILPGQILQKVGLPFLVLGQTEMAQLRWEPLDDVEGILWETFGNVRFQTQNVLLCRVDKMTRLRDPWLASSQFYMLGANNATQMGLEVRNNSGVALASARFMFWGYRYLLTPWSQILDAATLSENKAELRRGNPDVVRRVVGQTTWLPADGRQA